MLYQFIRETKTSGNAYHPERGNSVGGSYIVQKMIFLLKEADFPHRAIFHAKEGKPPPSDTYRNYVHISDNIDACLVENGFTGLAQKLHMKGSYTTNEQTYQLIIEESYYHAEDTCFQTLKHMEKVLIPESVLMFEMAYVLDDQNYKFVDLVKKSQDMEEIAQSTTLNVAHERAKAISYLSMHEKIDFLKINGKPCCFCL